MTERRFTYRDSDGVRRDMITDYEDHPGRFQVYTTVQMDEVLRSIERDRDIEAVRGRASPNKLVARVPMTVMETSIHEQWDESDWKKWLNDPENAAFRVWPGHV